MGSEIVYCNVCGDRILERDFQKGRAVVAEGRNYCHKCILKAPAKKKDTSMLPKKQRTTRIPKNDPPSRLKKWFPYILVIGIFIIVVILGIVVFLRG